MSDYGVYEAMEKVYLNSGGKVAVDSTFNINTGGRFIIESTQRDPDDDIALLVHRDATSVRQLSEWVMRMVQGQFPRIKDPSKYKERGERKVILRLFIHLYNFQASQVGINQIMNYFSEKDNTTFFGHDDLIATADEIFDTNL